MTTTHPSFGWHRTEHPLTTDKDISSEDFWRKSFDERDETFAWLRKHAPVSWHAPKEAPELPDDAKFEAGAWAVVKNETIRYVSENNELFSSDRDKWGDTKWRPMDPAATMRGSATFLELDPPDHTRYRQLMSKAFTPKAVARLSEKIEERAAAIVDRVVGMGEFNFVTEVSARLPMLTVADMIGIPESQVEAFAHAGEILEAANDPDFFVEGKTPNEVRMEASMALAQIGSELIEYRRKNPADDIATALALGETPDGRAFDLGDILPVFGLLSVAGNDTTKQTTTHTLYNLWNNPDQRAWLEEDFEGRIRIATEEFIRHASPVIDFARTATQDLELEGQQIAQGDMVVMFYCSGNRDEDVFEDPHAFNLQRFANGPATHVGFGGGGVHYCLGNAVAKAQLKAVYRNVLGKLGHMEILGEPDPLFNEFINGVKTLPVRA
jgi:cytochrome P450